MRKILVVLVLMTGLVMAAVKPADYTEVENTLNLIKQAMKDGQEDELTLYTAALEIVKKATVPARAEEIVTRILAGCRVKKAEFNQMRKKFSFLDAIISYAVASQTGENWKEVITKRAEKSWSQIFQEKNLLPRFLREMVQALEKLCPQSVQH